MFGFSSKNKNVELRDIPNLDVVMNKLSDKELFDLGYVVLYESLIAIRSLTSEKEDGDIWIRMITNATHNIPIKLKVSETSFLKEEIPKTITILYSLASSKLGVFLPISPHGIVRFFDEKGFNCTYY
ncbi:hypothetical protein [Bacillus pseudomycoides]|uniref:hypothetical protein n=1 Tax=Bacillus pseudomycoides TaxID=64104 RepID=UPI000BF1AF5E|nr:hypothetical protein [Bacillus pseudomycoides]PEM69303.1 hypothetical protein CN619_21445 [Bacillus pseudomycoides]PGA62232.1 hypothetical protein COL84_13760 [Bacillus pseudomycoides]